jgi:hypothetical protein
MRFDAPTARDFTGAQKQKGGSAHAEPPGQKSKPNLRLQPAQSAQTDER